ncbi:MAG: DNA repair protein RecN [Syntrophomonadaceae bacterium]|nr:DNA repair protein RecN [Bacillota bacterium]
MLRLLEVNNLALLDNLSFYPGAGLNVITGETGAGKSLLVGALELLLGGRAGAESVRTGSDCALLQAVFDAHLPAASEEDEEVFCSAGNDSRVVLGRELRIGGPNLCRVNGKVLSLAQLAAVTQKLIDLHGQHQQQSLLSRAVQRRLLDSYGGPQLSACLGELSGLYREYSEVQRQLHDPGGDAGLERKADFLRYQSAEIASAQLSVSEEEALEKRFKKLSQVQRLRERTAKVYDALLESASGTAVIERLGETARELAAAVLLDEELAGVKIRLDGALQELLLAARTLRDYYQSLEHDEVLLQQTVDRLDVYKKMKKKYGPTVDDVLITGQQIEAELQLSDGRQEKIAEYRQRCQLLEQRLRQTAGLLSEQRREAAVGLEKEIEAALRSLALHGARLQISVHSTETFGPNGQDRVEFLFSANSGEPLKPLAKTASGGEITRVMLAVKSVLAVQDSVPTLIFDEIDAGIGGLTVRAVAEKLRLLSRHRQVICVTHQPLLAAAADHHFLIFKQEEDGRTVTRLTKLNDTDREGELARMLGGDVQHQAALEHAREMLNTARGVSS